MSNHFGSTCFEQNVARTYRLALWLGAIMPSIGGVLGVYRFLFLHPNPFTIFHVLIDLVVVPICIYNLKPEQS